MATARELTAEQRRYYADALGKRLREGAGRGADGAGARSVAARIAGALKQEYGATRVVLFGSLVSGFFTSSSDIDLAVEGVAPDRFLSCAARAEELAGEHGLDIVDLALCRPAFRDAIIRQGVPL
jgi:predicted nucleotidyltransferase